MSGDDERTGEGGIRTPDPEKPTSVLDESVDAILRGLAAAPATGAGVFTPGETLAGKFEILRLLGKGGMGRVYLARDLRLGRKVAVKIIREDLATSPAVLERFLKEAKVTANLSHPNIVEIHDYGIHEGRPFIVLEHLLGEPLAARRTGKPQPDGIVLELVLPVVRALKHGHEHVPRIIHRDVKPENVFVCEDGRIKVLDFGLSGLVAPTAAPSRNVDPALVGLGAPREATRSTAGTLGYMAPEQFRGEDQDPRVDVWAVGVVLFEFLAGRRPFQDLEDDLEVFRKRVLSAAAMPDVRGAVPGVDPDLAGIVARCLAKDRDVRFPNAADLLAELERVAVRIRYRSEATGEPYRGLEPFSADDAAWFFGRGEDAAALLRALDSQALVGLIGPSGAGKTSLVQAGLARELRERGLGWEVLALRPGREPLRMLARRFVERTRADEDGLVETLRMEPGRAGQALRLLARKQGKRVLLFVDQAEELYTLSAAEPERRAFLAALLGAADDPHGPVRVLIAIRTDFVDRLAEHREFLKLLETGMLFLGPIDATGLAECLRRPAELKGYGIEAGIVADVVQALAARPGALPVLQMVGQKLWEARDEASRLLTRAAYDKAGGARGALAGHADAVLERLDPGTRELAGRVLCRLVTPERTRAAVLRSELQGLGDRAVLDGILDGLVRGRLLVVSGAGSDPSFELVHESLIDGWPRLRAWLDDDRSFADARETVRAAIRAGARLAGPLLQRVAAVFEAGPDRFSDEERAFLRANLASERRSRLRRLAVLLAIPTAVAIAALVAALLISRSERAAVEARDEADRQRQEAEGQSEKAARERNRAEAALSASQRAELAAVTARDDADRARAEAESRGEEIQRKKEELEGALAGQRKNLADAYRHLSGERLRDLRPDEAFLAASVSWTSDREADARAQVIQTFNAPSRVWAGPAAFSVRDFAFVPGTDIVVCATDRGLGAWSLGTGRLRWEERSHGIWSLDVTRDGRIMAVCGSGREIRILDPRSGAPVRTIESPDEVTGHLAFSPEGASLASSGLSTGKIRVWNVLTGQEIRVLEGEGSGMQWLDLAGIDDVLSTRDNQGTVVLLDPRSGREVRRFELQGGGFAVSRDGGLLAMGSRAGDLQVLDVRTDAVLSTLQGSRSLLHSLTFSPDARFLVSAGTDETVRLWNIATGRQVEVLGRRGTGTGPSDVAFSPDGRLIGWGDDVGTVRFRDMVDQKEIATLGGADNVVYDVAFAPGGGRWAEARRDHSILLRETTSGAVVARFVGQGEGEASSLDFSPDGTRLASGWDDGAVRIHDAGTGVVIASTEPTGRAVFSVSYSADGRWLATGGKDGLTRARNLETGEELEIPGAADAHVHAVAFSPRRGILAAADNQGTVRLWDVLSGSVAEIGHYGAVASLDFSPEGDVLATGTSDGAIFFWSIITIGQVPESSEIRRQEGLGTRIEALEFSPDGRLLASGGEDGIVRLWEVDAGSWDLAGPAGEWRERSRLPVGGRVSGLSFSPDGRLLLAGGVGTTVLWQVSGSAEAARISTGGLCKAVAFARNGRSFVGGGLRGWTRIASEEGSEAPEPLSSAEPVYSLALSPDGHRLATITADGAVQLWDAKTRTELLGMERREHVIFGVFGHPLAFSPDGRILAASFGEHTHEVCLWDALTGLESGWLRGHGDTIEALSFSPDGTRIATGSRDGTARIWDVASRMEKARVDLGEQVTAVAFSPARDLLATLGGESGVLRLWDSKGSSLVRRITTCPAAKGRTLSFSQDGALLAAAGCDPDPSNYGIRLYDTASGEDIAWLQGHLDAINDLSFSPDGTRLVSASDDTTIRVWDIAAALQVSGQALPAFAEYRTGLRMDGFKFRTMDYPHLVPMAAGVFEDQEALECMLRPRWVKDFEAYRECMKGEAGR